MVAADWRRFLFPADDPRITGLRGIDYRAYAEVAKADAFAGPMIEGWAKLYPQPFTGITAGGTLIPGLYSLDPVEPGEEAPTAEMVAAAEALLAALTPDARAALSYPIDATEWQSWANPEFLQHDTGLRLEELDALARERVLDLVHASLSERGYRLVRDAMLINGYLGEVVGLPQLMNADSYNVALYGTPSATEPWGWQLFGHHVGVNCFVLGDRMVVTPVFLGSEPSRIADGPHAGLDLFDDRIVLARQLMDALTPEQRERVIVYRSLVDDAMPPGRLHPGDERHLAGCFQDNRVIPYEGVRVAEFGDDARRVVTDLIRSFIGYLPEGPARARLREIDAFSEDTWFSWIGGWLTGEPFYLRIQSPVFLAELDHHCGVFLSNTEPADFHIHTVVRTPNGNDYGRALLTQHTSVETEARHG